jgi:hypothetical protein
LRFLGTDDSVNTCDCCGRADLKSTVAIETDAGAVVHYGSTCAAKALKIGVKEVKAGTKAADTANVAERYRRLTENHKKQDAAWQTFLDSKAPNCKDWQGKPVRLEQIASLGGMVKARSLFLAEQSKI